jgi:environmental stress-induced protein Ves
VIIKGNNFSNAGVESNGSAKRNSALNFAANADYMAALVAKFKMFDFLAKVGAHPSEIDNANVKEFAFGQSYFAILVRSNIVKLLEFLLEKSSDIN